MICECAKETGTILEFNANGYNRKMIHTSKGDVHSYPRKDFWNIVEEYNVPAILSSDCHSPSQLYNDTIKEVEVEFEKLKTKKVRTFNEI